MTSYVYIITNKLNNKSYIGKTNKPHKRLNQHYSRKLFLIGDAIKKYGKQDFLYQVIEEDPTEGGAYFLEWWNIQYYGTKVPNGYNQNDGGLGGINPSEETRKKLREAWKMRAPVTDETKRKMSEAKKGHKVLEETKKKIGIAQMGKKNHHFGKHPSRETKKKMSEAHKNITDETRQKLSEATKGENNPNYGKRGKLSSFYGKRHTEKTKRKMREAWKRRKKLLKQQD